jgi:hypothetical protein
MPWKRVWFAVLCAVALAAEARAQPPDFDPRSWKKSIAGPPTEVTVLGSLHLGQLAHPLDPALLGPLLDRLAAFKPTIVTIEALAGETCDLLTRYKAVYPEVADQYCSTTSEAETATGLGVAAAEAELGKVLAAWPAQPSAAGRRHLAALLLAANDRTSAVVQWLRLPETERRAGDGLDAALVAILRKVTASPNENIQIAAALAVRLGLERVYPIDDHTADAITAGFGDDFAKAIQDVWHAPHSRLRQALDAQQAAIQSAGDVVAYYRALNQPEALQDAIRSDFGAAVKQRTPQLYGRQYVAWWETRNLRMVANIRAAFANHPGARVLCVVGSSHKPYLDAYLDMMHEVKLVDPIGLLK